MPTVDELLNEFPEGARHHLRNVWQALPADVQRELSGLPLKLPGDLTLLKMLARMSLAQFRMAFGDRHAVAIVGPANVGKSTLYNQLVQDKSERAQVSPIPGTTRHNQRSDAGLFAVVDTPGADAVGEVGDVEKERAFTAAQEADLLIIMFDAVQGVKKTEQELFRELSGLGKPCVVVLNKLDLVRGAQAEVLAKAAANLHLPPEQVIGVAARSGQAVDRVLVAIAKAEPAILAALGQALPAYRWRLAWTAISGAASTSAVIALTPLPLVDFIPLVAVQSSMVLGIARIYDYRITAARARELVATFGLGYLGRTAFQELSKLGGPPGWALSAAVASATTVAMGYAAILWFERGEKLSAGSLKRITSAVTASLLEALKSAGRKKPARKSLQQRIQQALAQSGPDEERAALDAAAAGDGGEPRADPGPEGAASAS